MKLKISVAVACFLPGRAKDLSAPRYSIKPSVFITQSESVYCAVRTGFSNQPDTVSSLKGYYSILKF